MSKRTKAARRSSAEWASLIEAYARSGLSRAAFAEREGIHPRTFTWWASRLGGGTKRPVPSPGLAEVAAVDARKFVPVRVRVSAAPSPAVAKASLRTTPEPRTPKGVEVVLANGRRVRCDLALVDDPRLAALFTLADGVRVC
jgi:hypothetical protein